MSSQTGRVIVGYDGSPDSCAALDWAATHAQRHGLPLTVLNVVDYLGQLPRPGPPLRTPPRVLQAAAEPAEQVADEGRASGPQARRFRRHLRAHAHLPGGV